MSTLNQRLSSLRKQKNLSQEKLSSILNFKRGTFANWETGRTEPDNQTLQRIADFFGVTVDYLLGRTDTPAPSTYDIENKKTDVLKSAEESAVYHVKPKQKEFHSIPVLGTIRAGLPILAEDNWDEQIEIPEYLDADFALRVEGDSMSWIGIHEGDLALMEHVSVASHGSIVAAGIEDGEWKATLKFFVEEGKGKYFLRAANPDYEDLPFTPQHRIIGRLLRVIKETPTLHDYKSMVVSKEVLDAEWQEAIMKASQTGLDGKKVQNMLELFANVVKKVK